MPVPATTAAAGARTRSMRRIIPAKYAEVKRYRMAKSSASPSPLDTKVSVLGLVGMHDVGFSTRGVLCRALVFPD